MNIFLTGPVQVGKSTAIHRFLELSCLAPGGFRTFFGADRASQNRRLFICPAGAKKPVEGIAVVEFSEGRPQVLPGAFDGAGVEALNSPGDVILMDELGRFEKDSFAFRRRVSELLDAQTPVLGVMRTGMEIPWLEELRQRQDVKTLAVTKENREEIPFILLEMFSPGEKGQQ